MASLSLKERFWAWWEGYDIAALERMRRRERDDAADKGHGDAGADGGRQDGADGSGSADATAQAPAQPEPEDPNKLWSGTRIEVVERIWGRGFATPGGSDHIPKLVKPFGLNPAMTVLDLGAGLGGAMRAMVKEFGCWTVGYEADSELVKAANDRSKIVDMDRQAVIKPWDPESPKFDTRYDCIFSKETLFTVQNKQTLFESLEPQIKGRGQLLFTDYVTEASGDPGEAYHAWASGEPRTPNVWTVQDYLDALSNLNLDVRTEEDITDTHRSLILQAMQEFVEQLRRRKADRRTMQVVVKEIELWARRIFAIERAGLRVYRFYAIKRDDMG